MDYKEKYLSLEDWACANVGFDKEYWQLLYEEAIILQDAKKAFLALVNLSAKRNLNTSFRKGLIRHRELQLLYYNASPQVLWNHLRLNQDIALKLLGMLVVRGLS